MSATIYIEGGGDSKELHARCREGFRRLLESCGWKGRMPRLVACGGRGVVFEDFKVAHRAPSESEVVAMLVDSEEPVADVDRTWAHLNQRDQWRRPDGAVDEQVLLMTTCMETWIAADRRALSDYFGRDLQLGAIPSGNMEARSRHDIQDALERATRGCRAPYRKGRKSFELVGRLDPAALRPALPSSSRMERLLREKL